MICLSCLSSTVMANPNHILKSVRSAAKNAKSGSLTSSASKNLVSKVKVPKPEFPKHPLVPIVPEKFSHPEMLPYVAQARANGTELSNCYSGGFFQTEYNGQLFRGFAGPGHALEYDPYSPTLQRDFTLDAYIDGEFVPIPAHVEIVASMSMGDIFIATIPEEYMDKVQFGLLDKDPIKAGEMLSSFGFSFQTPRCIEDREVTSQTPLCIRTTMSLPRDLRPGQCGAPGIRKEPDDPETTVVDNSAATPDDKKVYWVGFHTGSSPAKGTSQDMGRSSNKASNDIGHFTKAFMVDLLVQSLFNDGNVTVPLELGNVKIFDMRLDEYISYIKLFDETGKQIWQRDFEYKFAYDQVNHMVQTLSPRYLEMTVRRIQWTPDGHVAEIRKRSDPTRYTIRFDFQEKTLSKSTPKSR